MIFYDKKSKAHQFRFYNDKDIGFPTDIKEKSYVH